MWGACPIYRKTKKDDSKKKIKEHEHEQLKRKTKICDPPSHFIPTEKPLYKGFSVGIPFLKDFKKFDFLLGWFVKICKYTLHGGLTFDMGMVYNKITKVKKQTPQRF